jgi:four helix bundle protein
MGGHRNLIAWQKAMDLVAEIYRVTRGFPEDERYGLVSQLRRAAVSVASNIAEGFGRNSRKELHHFIGQSRGSLAEVETQVEIAQKLGYIGGEVASQLLLNIAELGRILAGLRDWTAKAGD